MGVELYEDNFGIPRDGDFIGGGDGKEGEQGSGTRLKTALAILLPHSPFAWLLLIAALLISLVAIANFSAPVNVLIVIGCVAGYGIVQWVQLPKPKT